MENRVALLVEIGEYLAAVSSDPVGREIKKDVISLQAQWQQYMKGSVKEKLRLDYNSSVRSHHDWLANAEAILNSSTNGVTSVTWQQLQELHVSVLD